MATIQIDPYNSKTGAGTLSYYARQYGTTVDALAKSNNISNPNMIQAGAKLNVPDSGVIRTTSTYRQTTDENKAKFDQKLTNIAGTGSTTGMGTEPNDPNVRYTKNPDGTFVPVKDEKTDVKGTGLEPPETDTDKKNKLIESEGAKKIKEVRDNYDRIQRFADIAHKQLLEATYKKYESRFANMRAANQRLVDTKGVSNVRQGLSRYAPELAQGILTDEEQAGEERIATLEGEMLNAVAVAAAAKAEGDMKRFNAAFDQLETVEKNINDQIQTNFNNAVKRDEEIRAKEKAEREATKASFDQMLSRSEAAAPALAEQMLQFKTAEEQTAFLEAYAERTGVDMDILMGAVKTASNDARYKELQIENIENTIANRNTTTALARQREARLSAQEDDAKIGYGTKNVMAGKVKLDDLSDADRQRAMAELEDYGFYDEVPPQWFVEQYQAESKAAGDNAISTGEVQLQWREYRKTRGIID